MAVATSASCNTTAYLVRIVPERDIHFYCTSPGSTPLGSGMDFGTVASASEMNICFMIAGNSASCGIATGGGIGSNGSCV